jgi:hypothetical protein
MGGRSVRSTFAIKKIAKCLVLFVLVGGAAGARASQTSAIAVADRAPTALLRIGDSAKWLFDAAYASDWATANTWMQSIDESVSRLPIPLPKPDLVSQLRLLVTGAKEHVRAQERIGTMDDANAMTRIVADLSAMFHTDITSDVVMLGYYGRQLELGIAASRPATLKQAATDLRSVWNRIEPAIERRGRVDDARRFTDIVVALDGARRPADFVAPTRAELAEADHIEKLFH